MRTNIVTRSTQLANKTRTPRASNPITNFGISMKPHDHLEVSEVFKTKGTPTYTYVSVSAGTYEQQLCDAINEKGTLCLITGPSKTGKTTLIGNVCGKLGLRPLIVRCNAALTQEQLWKKALEQIDFRRPVSVTSGKGSKNELGGEVEGKLGWSWLAGMSGKVSTKLEKERSEDECRERILADPGPQHLIPALRHLPILLIIEDFHYLAKEVQVNIFQEWKAFVDEEVSVAVIETTHHACDIAFANKDLLGRVFHLPLTTWTEKDLAQIPIKGFDALNVTIDANVIHRISQESVGLPLLSQAICLEISLSHSIREKQKEHVSLQISTKELFKLLNNIAKNKFGQLEVMHDRITRGMRGGKRKKYKTYEYLLSVFSLDPIVYKLSLTAYPNKVFCGRLVT